MSDSFQPYELQPTRLLCPWDSPSNNTGVGCYALVQGIFPTQGSNPPSLPALAGSFFTTSATWEVIFLISLSKYTLPLSSVQSLNRVRLCDPMDYSTPGFPVHHQLPEPTQTHVHHVGDAIQPSHPLSSPSTTAFNLSQHQGFFQ